MLCQFRSYAEKSVVVGAPRPGRLRAYRSSPGMVGRLRPTARVGHHCWWCGGWLKLLGAHMSDNVLLPADEYPDGGWWFDGDTGWHLVPECEERNAREVQEALAAIDAAQANYPTCRLCGQRVKALDEFGLCSKKTHEQLRSEDSSRMLI